MIAQINKDKSLGLPYLMMILAIIFTIITLILFVFFSFQAIGNSRNNLVENRRLELTGIILRLNEVLTMSASMAVATGALTWEKSYNYNNEIMDNAIVELSSLSPNSYYSAITRKIDDQDKILDHIEEHILTLVKQKNIREAKEILNGPAYKNQRTIYSKFVQEYVALIQKYAIESYYNDVRKFIYIFIIIIFTFVFSLISWLFAFRSIRAWKSATEAAAQAQLEYDKNLNNSYDLLEKRVEERTFELNKKTIELTKALEELQHMQNNLVHSEKMAMIGELSAGIAHEVNNPLSFVISNISILKKRLIIISQLLDMHQSLLNEINKLNINSLAGYSKNIITFYNENKVAIIISDLDSIINESTDGLNRIKKIIYNLGSFINLDKEVLHATDVNQCIESAIEIVWNKLKYRIELQKNLSELPTILASPNQLQLVFMNLLLNAVQAIQAKGEICIVSKVVGSDIVITVLDNGSGISAENMSKIFSPFFTTKSIGEGMGLGLTTAFGIIKSYGGNIMVESQLGSGSIFTVQIPIK